MTTYVTSQTISAEVKAELITIGSAMLQGGLPAQFVADAVETAFRYEGVSDLVKMWREDTDVNERAAIVADIQDLIDDCAKNGYSEGAYIRFNDLEAIAKDIRAFKDSLRVLVDERGGVGMLADLTGIPQPSLSRFFESVSMPRRATLLKIAKALGLGEVHIAAHWSR
jgi:DNA-binding phage protein